jgi:hypothetical protein
MTEQLQPGEASARQGLDQLAALEAALADPVRLVQVVAPAEDHEAAVRALAASFGLTPEQASGVLDNQFGLLVRSRQAALAEELRVLRAPWGTPMHLELRARSATAAVVDVEGAEHTFTARTRHGLLDEVTRFLHEEVAVPRLRPVLLITDLPGGPSLVRIWPSRTAEYDPQDTPGAVPGADWG